MEKNIQKIIEFIRRIYGDGRSVIPLHEPAFSGNEKKYVNDCIDSTFVSSVGEYVIRFENMVADYIKSKYTVAVINGTSALHIALLVAGVERDDEVITQPLTFVATCNAISYLGASPVFVDVDRNTLGLSADSLKEFLERNAEVRNNVCFNKITGKRIKAVVPMHTFGHPCSIEEIAEICVKYNIELVEDAAESIGSFYNNKHTGTFGKLGIFSFNGNKSITTGNGGMIVTNDEAMAKRARHITTTAKVPHAYEYVHDMIGYNYRLSNINAAIGCAQMENFENILKKKRELAERYKKFFLENNMIFVDEPIKSKSNFWLNSIVLKDRSERDLFLELTNKSGILTRPIWNLMNTLSMYKSCVCSGLDNSSWLADRVVNLPSTIV